MMRRMKRTRLVGVTVAAALVVGGVLALGAGDVWRSADSTNQGVLPIEVQEAVLDALVGPDGEYAAYATYAAILEEYGDVNPFASILVSEARHIDALKQVLDRYQVPYPDENPYLGTLEAPGSLAEAAQLGVDAEIANVALYEEQLDAATGFPDIVKVFVSLQTASQERHLPSFERAVARLDKGGDAGLMFRAQADGA
ncbi:DUF2202 domain-containing protein [Candidatus Bipolaricaulota bacterium]|nr:DUF2202 domain-containing protein [Candidatus Bipolaricaulota bacterium]